MFNQQKKCISRSNTYYVIKYSLIGIILNICLFSIKFVAGLYANSITIIGDGINNLSDIGTTIVSCVGILLAGFGAGEHHPFGHGRIEWICGLFSSFCIMYIGIELFKVSWSFLFQPKDLKYSNLIVLLLIISILTKIYIFLFNSKISKKYELVSLKAVAVDSLSDAASTGAVLVAYLTQNYFKWNIDGFLGIIVAVLVIKSGAKICIDILGRILGRKADKRRYEVIRQIVFKYPIVINCYDIMIHDYGLNNMIINLSILVKEYDDATNTLSQQIQYDIYTKLGFFSTVHEEKATEDITRSDQLYELIIERIKTYGIELKINNYRMLTGKYVVFDLILPTTNLAHKDEIINSIRNDIEKFDPEIKAIVYCKISNNYRTLFYKIQKQ